MQRRHFLQASLSLTMAAALERHARAREQPAVGTGASSSLPEQALKDLREALHGRLLLPDAEGYDEARRVVSHNISRYPALIVQATGAADVGRAVDFAREHRLLLAVKCGGHNENGLGTCEGGMLIDLSRMRNVRVDAAARRAWVAGGSLAGLIDHETAPHGLAVPLGGASTVGIGGLGTGGGFGRIGRRCGLTIDSVRSVDIVTADGRCVHAGDRDNPGLLWAVRGGGGNFGVVTHFELDLHPMPARVVAGSLVFPLGQARQVLRAHAEFSGAAPDALYVDCLVSAGESEDDSRVELIICHSGDAAEAERIVGKLRTFGQVQKDSITAVSYIAAQGSDAKADPRSASGAVRTPRDSRYQSSFLAGITSGLVDDLVAGLEPQPGRRTKILFQHAGGAIGRTPNTATAFSHRYVTHNMINVISWDVGDGAADHAEFAHEYWQSLERHGRGFYNNDMAGSASAEAVIANYGENYPRLVKMKAQYDPKNLFRLNGNVLPRQAVAAGQSVESGSHAR